MRHVSDEERRARLAVRHALAPAYRVDSPEQATHAMTVLHATEAGTVYLSCWARVTPLSVPDLGRALYTDRTLVKQLAMRRTLFVFPRDLLPAVWPSASARVAASYSKRMARDIEQVGVAEDGEEWLRAARAEVLAVLAEAPDGLTASEVRLAAPIIDVKVVARPGDPWAAPRVILHLGATGDIVRATNTAHWRSSRPRWASTQQWLGEVPAPWSASDGYRELVRRWLQTFGPGTEDDLVWWLGSTKTVVRTALAELDATQVSLDRGETGWLLPDDLEEPPDPGSWVALLPALDATVMGWKGRDFYLGSHRDQLFDTFGNAGTTAWVDGRVVGCWTQDAAAVVQLRLLEPVSAEARAALEDEAARLTTWLDGVRIATGYPSPAMKA